MTVTFLMDGKEITIEDGKTLLDAARQNGIDIPTICFHEATTANALCRICIVEVEEIVETGAMDPDQIHLPGIYVHRIVHNPNPEKRIEKRTITEKAGA